MPSSWEGTAGTGAALATAIRGWERLQFEVARMAGRGYRGVVIRPPGTEDPRCRFATWRLDDEQLAALRSELYRRPGSFRERRLRDLGETIRARLLDPITDPSPATSRARSSVTPAR